MLLKEDINDQQVMAENYVDMKNPQSTHLGIRRNRQNKQNKPDECSKPKVNKEKKDQRLLSQQQSRHIIKVLNKYKDMIKNKQQEGLDRQREKQIEKDGNASKCGKQQLSKSRSEQSDYRQKQFRSSKCKKHEDDIQVEGKKQNKKGIVKSALKQKQKYLQQLIEKANILQSKFTNNHPNLPPYQYHSTAQIAYRHQISQLNIERIEISPRSESLCVYLDSQIKKINDHIYKIQCILNEISYENAPDPGMALNRLTTHVAHNLNNIMLATNFILHKLSYKEQQTLIWYEQQSQVSQQLKCQYKYLQNQYQQVIERESRSRKRQKQQEQELYRLRQVIQCYQVENIEMKNQIYTLQQVIKEMNIQIEKLQSKIRHSRRQSSILKQEFQKLYLYAEQLQLQITQQFSLFGQLKRMSKEVQEGRKMMQKWKARCFQEIQMSTSEIEGTNRIRKRDQILQQIRNIDNQMHITGKNRSSSRYCCQNKSGRVDMKEEMEHRDRQINRLKIESKHCEGRGIKYGQLDERQSVLCQQKQLN